MVMTASPLELTSLPSRSPESDEVLIGRIVAGEWPLFAILMRRHNQRLFRAARAIVKSDDEAEDVVQQVYLSAFAALSKFRGEAQLSTWLTRITINEALQRTKRSDRANVALVDMEAELKAIDRSTPEDEMYRREVARVLESQIDALPESLRVVFIMRDVQELDTAETAACLDLSEEAVRVRLHRARRILKQNLSELIESSPDAFRFDGSRCDRIVLGVMQKLST
jgi:RNA polymerase sigma-70 factor, ECF subfamily